MHQTATLFPIRFSRPAFSTPALPPSFRPNSHHSIVKRSHSSRTLPKMADTPTGPYPVSVCDVLLPESTTALRVRLTYPTPKQGPPAPWFPPSPTQPDETSISVFQFANIPASRILARLLANVPSSPLPASLSSQVHLLPSPASLPGDTTPIPEKLPVALFSHGLGGSIANYSSFCIELSSHGFLTVSPEHSDASAFRARIGTARTEIPYEAFNSSRHGSSAVFRSGQTDTRIRDLDALLTVLRAVDDGTAKFQPLRGYVPTLQHRMDFTRLVVAGHSFGATTALAYVARNPHLNVAKAICLDGWFEPLADKITTWDFRDTDVLFIDQAESRMKGSISARTKLPSPSGSGICDAVKVLGGMHNNASDFALRIPRKVAILTRMTAMGSDPLALLRSQNDAAVAFLRGKEEWLQYRELVRCGEVAGLALAELGDARVLHRP